jgi:hypothetical protein
MRTPADAYCTPIWCVRRLMERFDYLRECEGPWLEPGAGEGHIIAGVREFNSGAEFTAVEIREECTPILGKLLPKSRIKCPKDYFEWARFNRKQFKVVITNPPFRLAQEFIEASLLAGEVVIMLLRLNYLGSKRRHAFFQEQPPSTIYLLPDRPSFDHRGTDSIEYMWAVWDQRKPLGTTQFVWLDLTSADEKK